VIIHRQSRTHAGAGVRFGGCNPDRLRLSRDPDRLRPSGDPDQLRLSRRISVDGYQVVSVDGELDIATAQQAYAYLSDVIDHGREPVSVDLGGLTFCDASGLGVLARVANHAREAGRQFMLTSARPSLLKIMRITGLDSVFPELHSAVAR
jgi:anti-sigma B factor antagonist